MAKEYSFEAYAHPTLYSKIERKYRIYFSAPDMGVNKDTGILLFIAGFGGNANSNIYKKMRNFFSDKYNLVTIQCDYFGYEFMQSPQNTILNKFEIRRIEDLHNIKIGHIGDFEKMSRLAKKYNFVIPLREQLSETIDNYNEMGWLQAIDNVSAVLSVIEIINNNNYDFNEKKILAYGDSHGAYLCYLCNAISPTLFSFILDNSSWLFPAYLKSNRYVYQTVDDIKIVTEFEYLAKNIEYDYESMNISDLYMKFENKCNILCYHGTNDSLISHTHKKELCNIIKKYNYFEVNENMVDSVIFKNNMHGLGADFIKLFEFTIQNYDIFQKDYDYQNKNIEFVTRKNRFIIDYIDKIPKLSII